MKRFLIVAAAAAAALAVGIAIAVAATSGSGSSAKRTVPAVSVKRLGSTGKVLVDAKGRALYTNDQERGGKVLCTGACLSFWKPLRLTSVPKAGSLPGKLALAGRPDGGKQLTYEGKRLYTFTLDKPGKVTGDGFEDAFGSRKFTWHVAHPTTAAGSAGSASGGGGYPGGYPGYSGSY